MPGTEDYGARSEFLLCRCNGVGLVQCEPVREDATQWRRFVRNTLQKFCSLAITKPRNMPPAGNQDEPLFSWSGVCSCCSLDVRRLNTTDRGPLGLVSQCPRLQKSNAFLRTHTFAHHIAHSESFECCELTTVYAALAAREYGPTPPQRFQGSRGFFFSILCALARCGPRTCRVRVRRA